MLEASRPLLLVGGGKMGEALLAGWLRQGAPREAVLVVEPAAPRRDELTAAHGIATFASAGELPAGLSPSVLLLAVKPQMMDAALPPCALFATSDTLVLSIAAGTPIARFARAFGADRAIVRAMPNTPAAVGRGVTVLCANEATRPDQRDLAGRLMGAVGEVHWVSEEELMHAVTAVSGSGPAYVFYLIEALAAAAERVGLPADLGMRLARATVTGAGELAFQAPESAAQLRVNVTSPGGTTAAALDVLMAPDGLAPLLERAVAAAARRSRELA
ncbi:MAG: pyrroline-5-carboxylate reductase [Geminicoccaceae bacterium]